MYSSLYPFNVFRICSDVSSFMPCICNLCTVLFLTQVNRGQKGEMIQVKAAESAGPSLFLLPCLAVASIIIFEALCPQPTAFIYSMGPDIHSLTWKSPTTHSGFSLPLALKVVPTSQNVLLPSIPGGGSRITKERLGGRVANGIDGLLARICWKAQLTWKEAVL